ncbi:MAG: LysM peptidoglycan-binding domain-containing protein [Bacillota bacterium]
MKKTYIITLVLILTLLISVTGIQAETSYQVKRGDSLWGISQKFEVPVRIISRMNDINNAAELKPGQRLVISTENNQITISIEDSNNDENFIEYKVKHRDTLWKIAQRYDTTIEEIVEMNDNIESNYSLYIGQTLRIPADNTSENDGNNNDYIKYTVKSGDILWNIAQKYDTTVGELVELNNINNSYDLYPGRELLIPQTDNKTEPEDNNDSDNNNGNNGNNDNNLNNIPYFFYNFQEEDKIWEIADNFNIRVSDLIEFNNISNINDIEEDSIIIIPLDKSSKYSYIKNAASRLRNHYRVQSGETLAEIADYYNVPEEGLRAVNNLTQNEGVYTGQKLKMPVSPALFTKHELYQVNSEKYLFDIAYEKGVSISSILKANYLRNPNIKFESGDTIIVSLDKDSEAAWIDYEDGEPKNTWF